MTKGQGSCYVWIVERELSSHVQLIGKGAGHDLDRRTPKRNLHSSSHVIRLGYVFCSNTLLDSNIWTLSFGSRPSDRKATTGGRMRQ